MATQDGGACRVARLAIVFLAMLPACCCSNVSNTAPAALLQTKVAQQKAAQEMTQAKQTSADASAEESQAQAMTQKANEEMAKAKQVSADASTQKSKAQSDQQKADQELAQVRQQLQHERKEAADADAKMSKADAAQRKADEESAQARKVMLRYANPGDADPYGGHALSGAIPYVCIFILIILLIYATMHTRKVKQSQTKTHDCMHQLLKDRVNLWKKFDQLDEEARALEQGMTGRALEEPLITADSLGPKAAPA